MAKLNGFVQNGDIWNQYSDGHPYVCVSCGRKLEYSKPWDATQNHKCSTFHEASKLGAHRDHDRSPLPPTYHAKLVDSELMHNLFRDEDDLWE